MGGETEISFEDEVRTRLEGIEYRIGNISESVVQSWFRLENIQYVLFCFAGLWYASEWIKAGKKEKK